MRVLDEQREIVLVECSKPLVPRDALDGAGRRRAGNLETDRIVRVAQHRIAAWFHSRGSRAPGFRPTPDRFVVGQHVWHCTLHYRSRFSTSKRGAGTPVASLERKAARRFRMAHGHTPTWEMEDEYWRGACRSRPYWVKDSTYDDWRPAYRYGDESAVRTEGRARER